MTLQGDCRAVVMFSIVLVAHRMAEDFRQQEDGGEEGAERRDSDNHRGDRYADRFKQGREDQGGNEGGDLDDGVADAGGHAAIARFCHQRDHRHAAFGIPVVAPQH